MSHFVINGIYCDHIDVSVGQGCSTRRGVGRGIRSVRGQEARVSSGWRSENQFDQAGDVGTLMRDKRARRIINHHSSGNQKGLDSR
jgi:hypothetical protein